MKHLTLEILRKNNACKPSYSLLVERLGLGFGDDEPLKLSEEVEKCGYKDCLWSFRCFDKKYSGVLKRIAVKISIFAALKVLPIFEKEFPKDDRLQKKIEAAQAWLDNPCEETRNAASVAHETADSPVYAAVYAPNDENIKNEITLKLKELLIEEGF